MEICTVMRSITTFQSTTDRIYDGGPIILYNIIPLCCQRLQWNRSDWSVISPDTLASTKWVCFEPTVWPDTRCSVHRICNGQNVFKRTLTVLSAHITVYVSSNIEIDKTGMSSPPTIWRKQSEFVSGRQSGQIPAAVRMGFESCCNAQNVSNRTFRDMTPLWDKETKIAITEISSQNFGMK